MRTRLSAILMLGVWACGDDDVVPADARVDAPPATGSTCTSTGGPGGTHKLFLQFEGQTVTMASAEDATMNMSTIGAGTLAAFQAGAADRAAQIQGIVDIVVDVYAPYDVEVTTTRPATAPYTMIVVGGQGTDLGLVNVPYGVAPFSCNTIPNAMAFVFDVPGLTVKERSTQIVGASGTVRGIPSSNQPGECMCWNGPSCDMGDPNTPCTLGGSGTPAVATCTTATTMDTRLRFEQSFGCRP